MKSQVRMERRQTSTSEHRLRRRPTRTASRLMRLAAETREMLALWTYYRMACLAALDGAPMGAA